MWWEDGKGKIVTNWFMHVPWYHNSVLVMVSGSSLVLGKNQHHYSFIPQCIIIDQYQ